MRMIERAAQLSDVVGLYGISSYMYLKKGNLEQRR